MYLLGHNAKLLKIESPAVVADPSIGITGSDPVTRWSGSIEAYIDEDIQDIIRSAGGSGSAGRVTVAKPTIVDLPINLPVWPNLEDRVTFKRIDFFGQNLPQPSGPDQWPNEVLIVRFLDGGLGMLGKLRLQCVRD